MIVYHIDKLASIYRMYSYTVRSETDEKYELTQGGYFNKNDPNVFQDAALALLRLTELNQKLLSDYESLANIAYGDAKQLVSLILE